MSLGGVTENITVRWVLKRGSSQPFALKSHSLFLNQSTQSAQDLTMIQERLTALCAPGHRPVVGKILTSADQLCFVRRFYETNPHDCRGLAKQARESNSFHTS